MTAARFAWLALAAVPLAVSGSGLAVSPASSHHRLDDGSSGDDWAGYGRTFGQQHFSPLAEIDQRNVAALGLAWAMDLPPGNTATQPIAVDGVLYMATGLSVVRAVDAASGRELWSYDPLAAARAGLNLRVGWGVRGLAWWDGKVFVGTQDGRLLALDAATGKPQWSVQTYPPSDAAYISGAPRVFDGKVLIGFGGSTGVGRGYVSAYDAATGRLLWRFHTVPGDPAKPFENPALALASKTWAGQWWKHGGGGNVWNSMAYDPESATVFIGTGSPYPWNRRARSAGPSGDRGDNLFTSSIVALDVRTGAYNWHYQTTPGDSWDFDATMDIALAELEIAGQRRKVVMQAPKNGFFYVLDRRTGALISAEPFVTVTWASRVDKATGRPVEAPGARYPLGTSPAIRPTALAAHNWLPMATSRRTGLVYIPAIEFETTYTDASAGWKPSTRRVSDGAVAMLGGDAASGRPGKPGSAATGSLLAWSPITQKPVWRVDHPTYLNGGVLATGGGLVFQGTIDGTLRAYADDTGKELWRFDARAPILAPPIAYRVGGRQYVTVLTGLGMGFPTNAAAISGIGVQRYGIDPLSQPRRVLTFALGGKATLPPRGPEPPAADDPGFVPEPQRLAAGAGSWAAHCAICHGSLVIGSGHAPDLRRSPIPTSADAFASVVHDGALVPRGMPAFPEIPPRQREDLRHYIRAQAAELRRVDAMRK